MLRQDPNRLGARAAPARDLRLYPLRLAAPNQPAAQRVKSPAHVVLYRFDDNAVQIVRVLHAAMDLPARLRAL